jgi:lipoprotein-releasing system permease protein
MLGVTFGIAVFIFQAGLITGFQGTFIDRTVNTTANIHLFNEADKNRKSLLEKWSTDTTLWVVTEGQKPKDINIKIQNAAFIMEDLRKHSNVYGVSPGLNGQVIFKSGVIQQAGRVSGIIVKEEDRIFNLQQYMKEGDLRKLETSSNGIILGVGLAEQLGVQTGNSITVISQEGISLSLKVVGINETGLTEIDKSRGLVRLATAQKLLNRESNFITDINIKLKDISTSEKDAVFFQRRYGYKAEDWKVANANIFSVFKVQNLVTYLVIISILIVSGFGIFNIQMMIIYEKLGDIAILKAVGYKDRDVMRIFLTESLVIGVVGGLLGLGLGFIVTKIIGSIPLNIKGFVSMEYLSFNRDPMFFVLAFVFGLIATSLAGYLPARKASKIDPVNIIRGK